MLSVDSVSLLIRHKRETFAQGKVINEKNIWSQQLASIICKMMIIHFFTSRYCVMLLVIMLVIM